MFNSVALDVVIGLVFIYLLYSLLATILSEMVATHLGLRARNLKEAINRMLNDERNDVNFLMRFWDSLRLMKNPKNPIIDNFYNNPEIKYLGSSGIFRNPSSFKSVSFSKTLFIVLFGDDALTREIIDAKLKTILLHAGSTEKDKNGVPLKVLDPETAQYINHLWINSYGDIVKFKLHVEAWFDRTMEQCTEWYKRKIQVVLFVIGLMMAWIFNADTFVIISKLSNDKVARDKIVSMASAYVQNHSEPASDSVHAIENRKRLDELLKVKKELDADIAKANHLLGEGSWLPDVVSVKFEKDGQHIFIPAIEERALPKWARDQIGSSTPNSLSFGLRDRLCYFFNLLGSHFFGYFFTAIAVSLGAPFWFDLLNKLMKLRTSQKQDTNSTETKRGGNVSPLDREA